MGEGRWMRMEGWDERGRLDGGREARVMAGWRIELCGGEARELGSEGMMAGGWKYEPLDLNYEPLDLY